MPVLQLPPRTLRICYALIITCAIWLVACTAATSLPAPAAPVTNTPAGADASVILSAWAPTSSAWNTSRLDILTQAAAARPGERLDIARHGYKMSEAVYFRNILEATREASAPDIAFMKGDQIVEWAENGYIVPVDECIARYPAFELVSAAAWQQVTWQGRRWGIPLDMVTDVMYFNKKQLQQLGWSEAHIEGLPEQIERGEFSLHDLLDTAEQAVKAGVAAPGFGFWPRSPLNPGYLWSFYRAAGGNLYDAQGQLMVDTEALVQTYVLQSRLSPDVYLQMNAVPQLSGTWLEHLLRDDTLLQGRLLFWLTANWRWSTWAKSDFVSQRGPDYLFDSIGVALVPSALRGSPGHISVVGEYYAIISPQASGRNNQEIACELLAHTIHPDINTTIAAKSSSFSVLQAEGITSFLAQDRFIAETAYMLDYNRGLPPRSGHILPYEQIIAQFILPVTRGTMTPAEAAAAAIRELKREFGDQIIVE